MSSASTAAARRVFSGYRRLFRARSKLFKGDTKAIRESRVAIKSEFIKNANVATSGDHYEGLFKMIDETEDMLLHNVIQGKLNSDSGNYEIKIKNEHVADGNDAKNITTVEPITEKVVEKFENHHNKTAKVTVTKNS